MTNRTTINVTKDSHTDASSVKEKHGETWADVLLFYAEYRSEVSINGLGPTQEPIQDIDTVDYDDVKQACGAAINEELPERAFRQ